MTKTASVPSAGPGTNGAVSGSTRPAAPSAAETDERTRDRVLNAVLEHGPVSAAELGDKLGFTPAAVRRHLDHLSRNGLIEVKRAARGSAGAGRPARRYVLSSRGHSSLGDDYLNIAVSALSQLQGIAGEEAVRRFAAERFAEMESRYAPEMEQAGEDITARARALSAALARDGFAASAASVDAKAPLPAAFSSVQLCQGHCPIQHLATRFPEFCDAETEVFSKLVGVDVRRLSTLARGGHVCTTHIPTGRLAVRKPEASDPAAVSLAPVSTNQQGRP